MEGAFTRLVLPLYVATTVLSTLGIYVENILGEIVYFIISGLAVATIIYQAVAIARSGGVGIVVFVIITAYLMHLGTALLVNTVEKEPSILVFIVETWWYMLVAGVVLATMLVMGLIDLFK